MFRTQRPFLIEYSSGCLPVWGGSNDVGIIVLSWVCFQPLIKERIGLETEKFLQRGLTQDVPVVDFRWRTRT